MKRNNTVYFVCFLIALGIFLYSLWGRSIHIDDVWLAEYSYWLNKLGYVKSEAMRGFFGAEDKLLVHHKLMQIQGAWLIGGFGFNPYVLKSLSFIYTALTMPLLLVLYRRGGKSTAKKFLLLALFLSFFHTMNLGFTFRPESHLVFWGLLSYLVLDSYLVSEKKWLLVLSAFLSGVGIATHLNGVIFTGASVVLLWCYRRWIAGLVFGTVATWGLAFFFTYDVRSLAELQTLYVQLTNWRDVASGKYGWESLFRVFTEISRYLHSPPEIVYTLMLLMILIPARKYLLSEHRRVLLYTGLLSFFVAQITHGHNTNYLMYAMPFLITLGVWSFEYLQGEGRRILTWSAIGIFLVGSWMYDISEFFSYNKWQAKERDREMQKVVHFLPENAHVLSTHLLIFPGVEKLRIQSFVGYRDKVENNLLKPEAAELFREALKYDIEYVVVDPSTENFFSIDKDEYEGFHLMEEQPSPQFRIYIRNF